MKLEISKNLSKLFHVIAVGWCFFVGLLLIISIIGNFLIEPSFYHGWKRFVETFSPLNVANDIAILVSFLPAVLALKLEELFKKKAEKIGVTPLSKVQ